MSANRYANVGPDDPDVVDNLGDWSAVDIGPSWDGRRVRPARTVLRRSDGELVFPPGIGGMFGDSGDGKSWAMLVASLQLARSGRCVVWVTYEDVNEDEIVDRLKMLGATREEADRVRIITASEPLTTGAWHIARLCRRVDAALLVVDSIGEALAVEGLNEDKDADFGPWARATFREIYDKATATDWDAAMESAPCTSLTIIPIDHCTKSNDNPHFPSGSKRKRAMITGLMVSVNVRSPFARDQRGMIQLICSKDRTGRFRRGEIVAEFTLDATSAPYDVFIDPPRAGGEMAGGKKRSAAERVLEVIAQANTALTADEITRIANSDAYRLATEAELAPRTIGNTLTKLTGITKLKEPTGTADGYRIKYVAEVGKR